MPPLTKDQVQRRLAGIGASDVAAILGLDPYRTAYMVWLEKTGRTEPFAGNTATKMGHLLEPVVASLYEEKYGVMLRECETIVGDEPWMLATPDRIAMDVDRSREWLVEIKTKSRFTIADFGEPGTDQVPHSILCQVVWQQVVTGMTGPVDIAVLVDGREYVDYTVPFDPSLAAMLVAELRQWWNSYVVGGMEPEVSAEAIDYLKKRFSESTSTVLPATEQAEVYLTHLQTATVMEREAKRIKDDAKAHLMAMMQEAGGMKGLAGSISWRTTKGRTSWQDVAKGMLEFVPQSIFDELVAKNQTAPSRVFRFTPAKSDAPVMVTGAQDGLYLPEGY